MALQNDREALSFYRKKINLLADIINFYFGLQS
jgi:hypothetical protein